MLEPLRYFPLLSCLYTLHEVLHNASVQESAFLYMQGSMLFIQVCTPQEWLWQVVRFPVAFCLFRVQTSLYEIKHLKMVIRSVPDAISLILGRAERLGLAALHHTQQVDLLWHRTFLKC
jgi:hypothetical protein